MLFKNVQNLVDIVSNLRGTFVGLGLSRPVGGGGGGWCWWRSPFVVLSRAVSRTKGGTRSTFFLLVSTFLPSRHDVSRNSTAAAVSCVLKF